MYLPHMLAFHDQDSDIICHYMSFYWLEDCISNTMLLILFIVIASHCCCLLLECDVFIVCFRILWCSRPCCGSKTPLNPWISTPESLAWRKYGSGLRSSLVWTATKWIWWCMWRFHSGSRLLQKFDFPSMRFSLYFLGYEDKKEIPELLKDRTAWTFSRRATIELTQWDWKTILKLLYKSWGRLSLLKKDAKKRIRQVVASLAMASRRWNGTNALVEIHGKRATRWWCLL